MAFLAVKTILASCAITIAWAAPKKADVEPWAKSKTASAAKLKTGEHIILPEEDTPLANYWLTLCQQSGVEMDSFSHSTGTLKELIRS